MEAAHSAFAAHSLRCRDLVLSEQIVVWFVRRAFNSGVEATRRTALKVFGDETVEGAMHALDALAGILHRSPLEEGPLVGALRDASLSACEFDLLTALARAQEAGRAASVVDHWGWQAAADTRCLEHALAVFAHLLAGSGHVLPRSRMRPILSADDIWTTGALDRRERLLVESIRVWVAQQIQGKADPTGVAGLLAPVNLCAAAPPLGAILSNTCRAATRCVDVRCRECRSLSPDEARILHSISCLQRDASETAFDLLANWLRPEAARASLYLAKDIARILSATMHRLPLRSWRFPELDGRGSWLLHSARLQ